MPKAHSLTNRDTIDLHADWWSPEKDAAGRYIEHVTVFAQRLQADDDWIQARLFEAVDIDTSKAAETGNAADLHIDFAGAEKARNFAFQRLVVEMTDETGTAQPLGENTFSGMPSHDTEYIDNELKQLAKPLVQPTPRDVAEAKRNREVRKLKSAERTNPQLVAERSFR